MNRQALTKVQKPKNSNLLPSIDKLQRKTIDRTDFIASKVNTQILMGQQIDKPSLTGIASHFNYNFSKTPVALSSSHSIQAKLKIGQQDDKYEQEADRIAEQVIRMPKSRLSSSVSDLSLANKTNALSGTIRRTSTLCNEKYKSSKNENHLVETENFSPINQTRNDSFLQTKKITPLIQRQESFEEEKFEGEELEEKEELIQAKTNAGVTPEVAPAISSSIQSLQGGGRPLSELEQDFFEPRIGADFSNVRVHNNTHAASVARSVNARAFTFGNNVVFGTGEYSSATLSGRKLLAHELTHVVQQNSGYAFPSAGKNSQNTIPASKDRSTVSPEVTSIQAKLKIGQSDDKYEQEADRVAEQVVKMTGLAPMGADHTTDETVRRLDDPQRPHVQRTPQPPASGMLGLGGGSPMSAGLRQRFEGAFNWDFSGVRLHTGPAAANVTAGLGASAITRGRDVVFGNKVADPEAAAHRRLLTHELTHVVQQDKGAGTPALPGSSSLSVSAASPMLVQAAPLVTNVATSAAELGVGGQDVIATATVAGRRPRLTWSINPGGAAPAGVSVIGSGRRVRIRAGQPGGGAIVGGAPIVIRAEMTGSAPLDGENSPPVTLVQVVNTTYAAAPALANVPALFGGNPPANTAEPNRDGIAGNTAVVNAVTAPVGRPVTVAFRRSLGATVAGTTITPGRRTGDIRLRIRDTATRARLDEAQASVAGPAARMAELTVNAVPTRVTALTGAGALGPYGVRNAITFRSSDNRHPPLTRIVGELITGIRDDFNIAPPNGAFNPAFFLPLAVPANAWNDQLITPAGVPNVADALAAIDVNRFVGSGVPHLPRRLIYRQRFQYSSWQGAGAVVSNTLADGQHIRSLIRRTGAFQFMTEHRFGSVRAPRHIEPYAGNPLIVLTNVVATPTAAGATRLAADGVATANLAVTSNVAGRTVSWNILTGDMAVTAGNPAALPATATLRAGMRTGNFRVRASDSIFPNRRINGRVRVSPVRLRRMRATLRTLPAGTLTTSVSLIADPGGRTLNWAVDAAATAAGVTVTPAITGPAAAAPPVNVTVTRPAGFTGRVTVTATDSVLAGRTRSVRIRMR